MEVTVVVMVELEAPPAMHGPRAYRTCLGCLGRPERSVAASIALRKAAADTCCRHLLCSRHVLLRLGTSDRLFRFIGLCEGLGVPLSVQTMLSSAQTVVSRWRRGTKGHRPARTKPSCTCCTRPC